MLGAPAFPSHLKAFKRYRFSPKASDFPPHDPVHDVLTIVSFNGPGFLGFEGISVSRLELLV